MKSNSNLPKKRGRPVGSKNKRKVVKKAPAADKSFKQYDHAATLKKIREIDSIIADQERRIINFEHQIVGYKAVISYLEHQLRTK